MFTPPRTFAEFVEQYPLSVHNFALSMLGKTVTPDALDELCQSFYLVLLRKRVVENFDASVYGDSLNDRLYFNYIKFILTHEFYSIHNRTQTQSRKVDSVSLDDEMPDSDMSYEDVVSVSANQENAVVISEIRDCISLNSPHFLSIFDLMMQGYNQREIAEKEQVTIQTINNRIHDMHSLLRKFLCKR